LITDDLLHSLALC